jgi:phosphatidate cytidylyltransferase
VPGEPERLGAGERGALDRMDSVSFAAPIFFHITNYFYVP